MRAWMTWARSRGFSLAELIVTMAVIGILAASSVPFFLTYWRAATLRAGAQELATVLNGARQLAIRNNTSVCVMQNGTGIRYLTGGCGGAAWTGPGVDATGWIPLANGVQITGATATVVFTYLGAATPAAQYTLRSPSNTQALTVTVAASGRVSIP